MWQLIRVPVYTKIREDATGDFRSYYENISQINGGTFYDRILVNSILKFPFINYSKKDSLVFESSRKYLVEGNYIDIYTKYVCDDLREKQEIISEVSVKLSF